MPPELHPKNVAAARSSEVTRAAIWRASNRALMESGGALDREKPGVSNVSTFEVRAVAFTRGDEDDGWTVPAQFAVPVDFAHFTVESLVGEN